MSYPHQGFHTKFGAVCKHYMPVVGIRQQTIRTDG